MEKDSSAKNQLGVFIVGIIVFLISAPVAFILAIVGASWNDPQ